MIAPLSVVRPLTPVSPVGAARSSEIEVEKGIFSNNPSDGTGAAYRGGGRRGPGLERPGPRRPREAFAGPTLAPGRNSRPTLAQTPPPKKRPRRSGARGRRRFAIIPSSMLCAVGTRGWRKDLGCIAQAGRRRCRPRSHGHPPQCHPPQVRQFHPAGDRPDRCGGHRLRPATFLQSMS